MCRYAICLSLRSGSRLYHIDTFGAILYTTKLPFHLWKDFSWYAVYGICLIGHGRCHRFYHQSGSGRSPLAGLAFECGVFDVPEFHGSALFCVRYA